MGKKRVKTYNRYSEELKRKIAKSYLAGEASYAVLAEEHGLRNRGVVKKFVKWYRRKLAAEPDLESQQMEEQRANFDEPLQQGEQELQGRISTQTNLSYKDRNYIALVLNYLCHFQLSIYLKELEQALAHRRYLERQLMHHSDRGVQYCSKAYVARLEQAHISVSMTEQGDPLENPLAERMNGIFKDNFAMDRDFSCFEDAQKQVQQAIQYYNERLPHSSLDMMTPDQAYDRIGNLKKHWKWYWKEKRELQKLEMQETQADGIPNQTQS